MVFSKTIIQRSNINSAVNIVCKFKCYISKSKLVRSECNDLYFIAIIFIAFTLYEIKIYTRYISKYIHQVYFERPDRGTVSTVNKSYVHISYDQHYTSLLYIYDYSSLRDGPLEKWWGGWGKIHANKKGLKKNTCMQT